MKRNILSLPDFSPAVLDNEKNGPAILFLHGNSLHSESYFQQYNDTLLSHYRLIAIDFPGHGASPAASDPSAMYNLFYFRDLLSTIIDQLKLPEYIIVGHSLGGHVAMELLRSAKVCKGLFLTGAPPARLPLDTGLLFQPDERVSLLFKPELTAAEVDLLAALLSCTEHRQQVSEWLRATDPAFREHFPASLAAGMVSDEFLLLKNYEVPFALVLGEKDALINHEYVKSIRLKNLWKGKAIIIEKACHIPQWENPVAFNALLNDFVRSYLKPE